MANRTYKKRPRGRSVLDGQPPVEFMPEGNDYFPESISEIDYEMSPVTELTKRRIDNRAWADHMPIPKDGNIQGFEAPREFAGHEKVNPAIQQIMNHFQREAYLRRQFPDILGRGTGLIPKRDPMDGDYHRMWGEGGYKGDAVSKGEGFDPALVDFAKGLFSSVGDKVQKGKDAATTTAMNVMDWLKGLR